MQHSSRAAVVAGIGAWVPPRAVTNEMLAGHLDTTDEWIRCRTGIRQRYMVDAGLSTSDLAVEAGSRALKSAGTDRVDAVVLATATPDRPCPATAPEVASRLGLPDVAAFDVGAVCTGFVYALATGAGLIASGVAERMLVVAADAFSTILDPTDRTTAVIFGDGAGAVVLRAGDPAEPGALRGFDLGSDGSQAELIMVPGGGSRQRSGGQPPSTVDSYFTMQGKPVFMQAVVRMAESARTSAYRAGWRVEDIDALVAHQANLRIVHAVAERLGLPSERAVVNIDRVGNTAGASIPLALADAVAAGTVRPGHRLLFTAFGGGLTWGSVALDWPDIAVP